MKGKLLTGLVLLGLLFALAGCQLAREDVASAAESDKLIGIYITEDTLDLSFGMEGYLNDHVTEIVDGETIDLTGRNLRDYEEKLCGMEESTLVTLADGTQEKQVTYTFPGMEGVCFLLPTYVEEGESGYWKALESDAAVHNEGIDIKVTNTGDEVSVKGTIYIPAGQGEKRYNTDAIYQTPDGEVYLLPSSSYGIQTGEEGESIGIGMEESKTVTADRETKTEKRAIQLNIRTVAPVGRLVLLQMDADSRVLDRREFMPGQAPETLTPQADTAYIILESHRRDGSVDREIFNKKDETLQSYDLREDGYYVLQDTELLWPS